MLSSQSIPEQELKTIKDEMLNSVGIDLTDFKVPFLTRRINARMMFKNIKSISEYVQLITNDPYEPLALYNSLSINVTECFRDPDVWNTFTTNVLPEIIKQKNGKTIRIWSAGCATGQEPYSLAMMFNEAVGSTNTKFEIIATDMNKVSINIAMSGKYDLRSLKNIPSNLLPKYVQKIDDELYKIREDLTKSIKFQVADVSSFPIDSVDLIVCRNLLIYYGRDAQELLFKKFHKVLNKDGFVVLGMDETMIGTVGTKIFNAT